MNNAPTSLQIAPVALDVRCITTLPGMTSALSARLARLNIHTLFDLLLHLPLRYQNRTHPIAIAQLVVGQNALIEGIIQYATLQQGQRRSFNIIVRDAVGDTVMLRFFHFTAAHLKHLQPGQWLRCYGEIRRGFRGLEIIHPDCEWQPTRAIRPVFTPIYPSTAGVTQFTWRRLITQALALLTPADDLLQTLLPQRDRHLPTFTEALHILHRPPATLCHADLIERRHPACQRLALEELLAQQLALRQLRDHYVATAPALISAGQLKRQFCARLKFTLTNAQQRVCAEVTTDLMKTRPMLRLLQGDVGSGKTVVAVLAALQAVEAGYQVALMAPTELLTEQHQRYLHRWLMPLGIQSAWLAGRHKGKTRRQLLAQIKQGQVAVVVGTHALFQSEVQFAALGLVIIDEQHRFGVQQRLSLRTKGELTGWMPHQLIMTATPIPRSLAMVAYADLALSVIDELPHGRQPIKTVAVPDQRRSEVIARLRAVCTQGQQAYWVCTLIDESEIWQCQAAEVTAATLQQQLPELRIGLIHGRLKPIERENTMAAFVAGQVDVLVATTVIEVGIDVVNATLMIIENPERLGLAQLHQLRGRVGRGITASYCLLLYHPPLTAVAAERLRILRQENNGFKIADADLRLRGAGDVLGTQQTGTRPWRCADPIRDAALIPIARAWADELLTAPTAMITPLLTRWLGQNSGYGHV